MFGKRLHLPVDIGLGVSPEQAQHDLGGWVQDRQQILTTVTWLESVSME